MRRIVSSGSVKGFYLNREEIIERLMDVSNKAVAAFPDIQEIRLFGSLAKAEQTGLSDVDIFILTDSEEENPVERMRPYFGFFSDRIDLGLDMIVATRGELETHAEILKGSVLLGER